MIKQRTGKLEKLLAKVEGAAVVYAFSASQAATLSFISLFKTGDKIMFNRKPDKTVSEYLKQEQLEVQLVDDFNQLSENDFATVKGIFVETPSFPFWRVTDIQRINDLAHKHGILVAVDNSFLTPYYQKTLSYGSDFVIYSAIAYLSGRSDIVASFLATDNVVLAQKIEQMQKTAKPLAQADENALIGGIEMLATRLDQREVSTLVVIDFLQAHKAVKRVYYAGNYSRDEADIQEAQATGIGAQLSFELADNYDLAIFLANLTQFAHAEVIENLVQLTIGIENKTDLIAELAQAFEKSI
ncbi:cystathionine gamma-synthase [Lactococcus hodotermopsidis]|uniref:Cystathionine gamma-synthase n=1 Tax=Pseudolactococcus hodotermopsidis TaxID=2709157 RepID=A0A6A0BC62_9LACT|nr:PLP-dependent transferase [Lactococcus hodotermopsidis]GFH42255.1 cystathionine gamma-synthase [Lactococcus hodotermopsidis]